MESTLTIKSILENEQICLAFLEYELVDKTVGLLENQVDLFVFDGNGYLHPRHMGFATYAGIISQS